MCSFIHWHTASKIRPRFNRQKTLHIHRHSRGMSGMHLCGMLGILEHLPCLVAQSTILDMGSANERRRYIVTPSLIGWDHTHFRKALWAHNQNLVKKWFALMVNIISPAYIFDDELNCLWSCLIWSLLFLSMQTRLLRYTNWHIINLRNALLTSKAKPNTNISRIDNFSSLNPKFIVQLHRDILPTQRVLPIRVYLQVSRGRFAQW